MTTASLGSATDPATAAAQQSDAVRTPRKPRGGAGRGTAWYRRLTPYYFLLIPVGLLLLLTFAPVVNMFWYSVTDWDGLDKTKNFVGFDNYVEVFTDPDNVRVFYVSLYYFVASFVQMAIALYFATILSLQHPVQEPVEGHPVLPVPDQRRRDRLDLPQLLQAGRRRSTRSSWRPASRA